MNKIAFFTFTKEKMCFIHALLNAIEYDKSGKDVKIIVEGGSVVLLKELEEEKNPVYFKAKKLGLFEGVCKACSQMLGVLEDNESIGIPVIGDMVGHPAMQDYTDEGYNIITI